MSFEQQLQQGLFSAANEKTFIDKLLGREDINNIRKLIKKKEWTREDLLDVLYLINSGESKLFNYSSWDRYIILKFFVWIREFVKVLEMVFDDKEAREARIKNGEIRYDKETEAMYKDVRLKMEHNAKFLIDLYITIGRTSLSLGATGFLEILKNKYEISYPQGVTANGVQNEQNPTLVRR